MDEPIYFRRFQEDYPDIKVNTIENQRSGRLNLNSTVLYCEQKGLTNCQQGAYKLKHDITEQIWCVYDRDLESDDLRKIKPLDDIAFTTSIQTAENTGIKVAWSNDSFELWLLLHFEKVPIDVRLHRKYIYAVAGCHEIILYISFSGLTKKIVIFYFLKLDKPKLKKKKIESLNFIFVLNIYPRCIFAGSKKFYQKY